MESRISLALGAKLRMLFEKDDKYLTFPLGTGFTYRYLNFMKDPSVSGLTLQEQLNNKGDFARLLNIIPADTPSFSQDASRFLWDALITVLKASSFADSALTTAESRLLDEAIDFLTDGTKLEDGTAVPVNSVAVNKYYEYKTLFDQAEATYLNEKISVESSTGPEGDKLKKQWSTYREKQLHELMDQAEQNWINLGFREQVKHFQQVRNDLEPKKYLSLYKAAYLHEVAISEVPDLNGLGVGVYTTFFSPFDVFESSLPWTKINLTKTEIDALVQGAPADLKAIFNAEEGSTNIESVSLEYNNIAVIRPWYKPEFFGSRYWKLTDETMVSDGNIPRHGMIPSYITSMIVGRNLVVTRHKSEQQNPIVLPILTKAPVQTLKIAGSQWETPPIVAGRRPPTALRAEVALRAETPPGSEVNTALMRKSSFALASAVTATAQPIAISARQPQAIEVKQSIKYAEAKYRGTAIKYPVLRIPDRKDEAAGTGGASLDMMTETFPFDGVFVLAYACKRVPKSPDPDPALKWM
jgi:hypothetical protein